MSILDDENLCVDAASDRPFPLSMAVFLYEEMDLFSELFIVLSRPYDVGEGATMLLGLPRSSRELR